MVLLVAQKLDRYKHRAKVTKCDIWHILTIMTRKIKYWPSQELTMTQKLWGNFAPQIIRALAKVPGLKKRLEHLDYSVNHPWNIPTLDAPKPENTEIKMQEIVFLDFFRIEDFEKVKDGLRKMQKRYKSAFHFRDTENSFSQFERYEAGGSGWMEFDSLALGEDRNIHLAETMLVQLYWVSPSFLILALIVEPSAQFHEKFENILTKSFPDQISVSPSALWSAVRKKSWRVSHAHGAMQREVELQKLLFSLNQEISLILQNNIGKGWTLDGPLPTIEVISLERGKLPEPNSVDRHFWGSIGIELADFFAYRRGGITLFRQDDMRKKSSGGYKVVVEKEQFMSGKSTDGYASPESALKHLLQYDHLVGYFVAIGIKEHIRRLVENITIIRREIAPELTASKQNFFSQSISRRMSVNMEKLNQIKFEIRRTGIEIDLKKLHIYPVDDLKGFVSEWKPHEKRELLDDLQFELERQWNYANLQLESLRENYRDKFDFSMQKSVLALTIITAVLAAFSLPDWVTGWFADGANLLRQAAGIVLVSVIKLIEFVTFYIFRA